MTDFTFAVLDGDQLLKGSLHEPIPAMAWVDGDWVPLRTSLSVLSEHQTVCVISDQTAHEFIARQMRREWVSTPSASSQFAGVFGR
jgi:hypothetical protein